MDKLKEIARSILKEKELENVGKKPRPDVEDEASAELDTPSADKGGIQQFLQKAYEGAKALGDDKLLTQIGNTITYFTRTQVLTKDQPVVAEGEKEEMYEMERMQELAGVNEGTEKDSVYIENDIIIFHKSYMSRYGEEIDEIVDFINENSNFEASKVDENYFSINNSNPLLENIAETLKDFFE